MIARRGRWRILAHSATIASWLASIGAAPQSGAESEAIRAVRDYHATHEREIVAELVGFLSLPNVAANIADMHRNADALVALMERRGIESRLIDTGGAPHVFGELNVPGATRTILFYCHFDGQPVDASRWVGHEPFEPVFRDGALGAGGTIVELPPAGALDPGWRLYARSSSDDKAPIIALMAALDALGNAGLRPTSNLKFFFEGDEEAGSPTLSRVVREHRDALSADLVVAADGPSDPSGLPTFFFGARGIVTLDVTVYGPARPLHSGHYGNWAPNPALRLSHLLASMKDPETGEVYVDGFYDDIEPLSDTERRALAEAPDDDREQMRAFGIARQEGVSSRYARLNLPSLNVRGLRSAWVGSEARTIVPDAATASIDLRLVKGYRPEVQVGRVVAHIEEQSYVVLEGEPSAEARLANPLIATVTSSTGYPAFRTSMDLPVTMELVEAIEHHTGRGTVRYPTTGGSVPLYLFTDVLAVPTVILPIVNHDNNQHSPNENLLLGHLWSGIETLAAVMLMR